MSQFRPDISQLMNAAFGISRPIYKVAPADNVRLESPFTGVQIVTSEEGKRLSMYGHPVLFPFTFMGNTYKKFDQYGELVDYPLPDFELPATTLVDFSRSKIITYTDTSGIGKVKEMYGFDDWQIRIRGFCLLDNSHPHAKTASEQRERLLRWEEVAGHVEIKGGELFTEKGIRALVIESFSVTQLSGNPDLVPFEMSCRSDTPFELEL